MHSLLDGLRVLLLEDEFLIAMDVEQLCRDHGAADVAIVASIAEAETHESAGDFDAAIVDLMLAGQSTLDFARRLMDRSVPFVVASGYGGRSDVTAALPGITIVEKPYAGDDLVRALAAACGRMTQAL